jgi:Zn-dependent protease
MELFDIQRILKFLPGIILGLTVHEFSHALMARRCGDMTSYHQGRVTLNPLKHIDPLGFIMLIIAGFGWAKPVQFNENNLRNPKTDVIKIAVSGPISNAITAMVLSVLFAQGILLFPENQSSFLQIILEIFLYAIYINWGLFVFNLIPLPPLDGSHLLFYPLKKFPRIYEMLYHYGALILFGLLIAASISKTNILPIWPLIQHLGEGFLSMVGYS